MQTPITCQVQLRKVSKFAPKLGKLTIAGGLAFWAATVATSLLPIAAEYRAAYTGWSIHLVWVNSLLAGAVIGGIVSYFFLRFMGNNPTKNPIVKSMNLSAIAFCVVILLIDLPMAIKAQNTSLKYLLIGILFNAVRFLLLGFSIGSFYKKLS